MKKFLVVWRAIDQVRPSPENRQLYKPVSRKDPAVRRLADQIRKYGVLEPIVITSDGCILSGHRRWVAAQIAGLKRVPVRVYPVSHDRQPEKFLDLLQAFNGYRHKSHDELLHEEIISHNREDAYQALIDYREERALITIEPNIEIRDYKARSEITEAKRPFLDAIIEVINERDAYWPLSVRQVHYLLLNNPPLRHASKPDSIYRNDRASYQALDELTVRARLAGDIPSESIDDETRPVECWDFHRDVQSFISDELYDFLRDYRRDLMQSQPNHIEIVGEKLTVQSLIRPVAEKYCIPYSIARGFSNLPVREQVSDRFLESGKSQLVLLFVADLDPDGEEIAHSFTRSMRDDFALPKIQAFKVALTAEQVSEFDLPEDNLTMAKKTSSNYERFAEKHGNHAYELEAASPQQLQDALSEAIESVLDISEFNAEVEAEKEDAAFLKKAREQARKALADLSIGK